MHVLPKAAAQRRKRDVQRLLRGEAFVYSLTCEGEWKMSGMAGMSLPVKDAVIRDALEDAPEKTRAQLLAAGFARVDCINPPGLPREEALKKEVAQRNLAATVQGMCVRPSAG